MTTTRKLLVGRFAVKDAAQGVATAVFATVSPDVPDLDGDVYSVDAIRSVDGIVVSPWNHSSAVTGGELPVGVASVRVVGGEAVAGIKYFLDSEDGRRAFDVVQKLGAAAQWSWSLDIHDTKQVLLADGRPARQILDVTPLEVSPVMMGAGIRTRTLTVRRHPRWRPASWSASCAVYTTGGLGTSWSPSETGWPDDRRILLRCAGRPGRGERRGSRPG